MVVSVTLYTFEREIIMNVTEINQTNFTLDVNHLENGVYLLEIQNDRGNISTEKLIIR